MIDALLAQPEFVNPREREFLAGAARGSAVAGRLTKRQQRWLRAIHARLKG